MNKSLKYWLIGSFLAIELALYLLIVFIKTDLPINVISYIAILTCVVFMLVFYILNRNKTNAFMLTAICFTALSDYFLVLLCASNQALAMTFFSVAQLSYFVVLILTTTSKKQLTANIITRGALFIILEIIGIIVLKENFSYLVFITLFYFANLLTNIIFAFVQTKTNLLFALGLLLFLGCDIMIGFDFLAQMLSLAESNIIYQIAHISFNITWLCYLPSQVLLVLSSLKRKQDNKKIISI